MTPLGDVITETGFVRYHLLFQNPSVLKENIRGIEGKTGLGEVKERRQEDLAFYCNAYNFWSMYLAYNKLEKTGKKWKGNVNLYERARFFKLTSITVAGKRTNSSKLENGIIRKYGDARIHFAINCSSYSCPPLPTFLFSGDQLDQQLEAQTRRFINEAGGVILKPDENLAEISAIFKWYKADFEATKYESIVGFINHYLQEGQIGKDMRVVYQPYDWSVNWAKSV